MIELFSKETVKTEIDLAEKTLRKCFDMLIEFRHGRGDIGVVLNEFQPMLAECLYELMQFYHKLQTEKKQLIQSKSSFNKKEFSTLMSANASYIKVVSQAIELGKSIGDAFAWFFFRDNRPELDKHFEHNPTGLYVSGIGGFGELEFIKNNTFVDGLYVLYHGITTMLRIGDISLYHPEHGIVGVGELKTIVKGDKFNVSVHITAKTKIQVDGVDNFSENNKFEEHIREIQKDFPSIKNQLKMQSELIQVKDAEKSDKLFADFEYELLDQLSQDVPIAINSDKSLLLIAQWSKFDNLFSILFELEEIKHPEGLIEKANSLMDPADGSLNELVVGKLVNHVNRMSIPILWWDINEDICRDIYFNKISIATVFNPAKLLKYYVDDGFTVKAGCELEKIEITKEIDQHQVGIGNFGSICYLISNGLMKTEAVYAFSRKVIDAIESGEFQPNSQIEMQIHLDNFGPPSIDDNH